MNFTQYKVLPDKRARELVRKAKTGSQKAKDVLVLHHIRMIPSIIKSLNLHLGNDTDDLMSEGCLGLMRAVEKYDLKRKTKFSTYAYYWIKQRLLRYRENLGDTVRLPTYIHQMHRDIAFKLDHDIVLTEQEERVASVGVETCAVDEENLSRTSNAGQAQMDINVLLSELSERDRKIITKLLKGHTLRETGRMYRLTGERIRQIRDKAIKSLKKRVKNGLFFV